MKRKTTGPMRTNIRQDCQAWPGWMIALCDDVDALVEENARLRVDMKTLLKELRGFLAAEYPEISSPGWFQRDQERMVILEFLRRFQSSQANSVAPEQRTAPNIGGAK